MHGNPTTTATRWHAAAGVAVLAVVAVISAACTPPPPQPPSDGIALEGERTLARVADTWETDFYRNSSFKCGGQGNFTFVVIEPRNDPGAEAPLWVLLHGGGVGYYKEDGVYVGPEVQNLEESFDRLLEDQTGSHLSAGGQAKDTILARRLAEGYRVLVPSMCDHDLHSGEGTEYPNNPNYGLEGDTVDGLLANRAALQYVVDNFPTTNVFAQGTSAGSVGVFSLAVSLHEDGIDLNGVIMDSYIVTDRLQPLFDAGITPQQNDPSFDLEMVTAKVGRFADEESAFTPEAQVLSGFTAVPMLDIVGELDATCAGDRPPVPAAAAIGNNCLYVHQGFADAVQSQADSPHESLIIPDAGHVPTKSNGGPTHDWADEWLEGLLQDDPPNPFG